MKTESIITKRIIAGALAVVVAAAAVAVPFVSRNNSPQKSDDVFYYNVFDDDTDLKDNSLNPFKTGDKLERVVLKDTEDYEPTLFNLLSESNQERVQRYYSNGGVLGSRSAISDTADTAAASAPAASSSSSSASAASSDKSGGSQNNTPVNPAPADPVEAPSKEVPINAYTAQTEGTPYDFENLKEGELSGTGFDYDKARAEIDPEGKGLLPERNDGVSKSKKLTVMLYICGTDLETDKGGLATNDIRNIIKSNYDLENVNVLICAGGTNKWQNSYMKEINDGLKCNVYVADPTAFHGNDEDKEIYAEELPLLASFDAGNSSNMGNAQLLSGFVDFAAKYFPADNYGLILNNHGGGVIDGICFPEAGESETAGKSLKAYDIESALRSSKTFGKDTDKRLSFIAMDACLMGSAELAMNLSPYCDYYVGCSEIETGSYNYEDLMGRLSAGTADFTSKKAAESIVDSYFDQDYHLGTKGMIGDVVCIDSSRVYGLYKELDNFSNNVLNVKDDDNCKFLWDVCLLAIDNASLHSDSMGLGASDTANEYTGYVDALGFLKLFRDTVNYNKDSYNEAEKQKVEEINKSIESVFNTKFVVSGGVYYDQEKVYRANGGTDNLYSLNDIDNMGNWNLADTSKWNKFKETVNSGISLCVPRIYGSTETAGGIRAKDRTEIYSNMNIVPGFSGLMKEYCDYQYSPEIAAKRNELVAKINYAQAIMPIDENASVLLQRFYTTREVTIEDNVENRDYVEYVKVKFNNDAVFDSNNTQVKFTYDDVAKTVKSLQLYIDRYQNVQKVDEEGNVTDDKIKLLVGDVAVPLYGMAGTQNALNIKAETIADAMAYQAFGYAENTSTGGQADPSARCAIVDWATRDDTDKANKDADTIKILGSVCRQTDDGTYERTESCTLIFEKDKTDEGKFLYTGAETIPDQNDSESKAEQISNVELVSFLHYYIQDSTEETGNVKKIALLEGANGIQWTAPVYKVMDAEGNVTSENISLYRVDLSEKKNETANNYNLGFTRDDDNFQIVSTPSETEEDNKTNTPTSVWTPYADDSTNTETVNTETTDDTAAAGTNDSETTGTEPTETTVDEIPFESVPPQPETPFEPAPAEPPVSETPSQPEESSSQNQGSSDDSPSEAPQEEVSEE